MDTRFRRRALIAFAGLLVLAISVSVALRILLDQGRLRGLLNAAVADATDSLYVLEFDRLDLDFLFGRAEAMGVRVRPDSAVLARRLAGSDPLRAWTEGTVGRVELSGVSLWHLLTSRGLRMNRLTLARPDLEVVTATTTTPADGVRTRPEFHSLMDRLATAFDWDRAPLRIRHVVVTEGRLAQRPDSAPSWRSAEATGLEIEARDLIMNGRAAAETTRIYFARSLHIQAERFRRLDRDSLQLLELGPLTLWFPEAEVAVDSLSYLPTVDDATFRKRKPYRKSRYALRLGPVRSTAVDLRGLLHGAAVRMGTVDVGGFDMDILLDKRMPAAPPSPRPMPNDLMRRIRRPVRIDSLRLQPGRLVYAEVAPDGVRPGRVRFEELSGVVSNVSNDSAINTPARPATLDGTTRINDQGPLGATIRLPLTARTFDPSFEGRIENMHVPALTPTLLPLEGTVIESGEVRRLRFEGRARDGVASGTLTAVYDNFSIRMVDKRDGGQSVGKWIKTFITSTFVLHGSNLPDDHGQLPRAGTIEWTREPSQTFWSFLWASVRSGIFSQIGR